MGPISLPLMMKSQDLLQSNRKIVQFVRFGLVGTLATATHYGLYLLLLPWTYDNVAYTIGYATSFLMNFMLTSFFTFRTRPTLKKLAGFGGSHGVNYLLHMVLFNIYLFLGVPPEWAPLPVYAVCVPVNFMLVRFVMRRKKKHGQEPEKITET